MTDEIKYDETLYKRMKAGDDSAREELILKVDYLVHYFAKQFCKNDKDLLDDLTSEAYVELVASVDRWEFRGKEFKIYASQCIKYGIMRYLDRKYSFIYKIDNDKLRYIEDESNFLYHKLLYDDKHVNDIEFEQIFDQVCKVLTDAQKHTMVLFYKEEMKTDEISEIMDISTSSVGTNICNARNRIKEHFTKEQLGLD